MFKQKLDNFKRVIYSLSRGLSWAAAGAVCLMVLLVCTNIVTRLFGQPVTGTYELVGFMLVVVICFALAYGAVTRCHTTVNILVRRFSQRTQAIIDSITGLVSIGLFALLAWQCILLAARLRQVGEVSPTLWLPMFPLLYGVAFCCIIVCLVLLIDFSESLTKAMRK